jgi:transposase
MPSPSARVTKTTSEMHTRSLKLCSGHRHAAFQLKTDDQLDLQALHRVRSRLVGQRTAVINQIRSLVLERCIAVRQGLRFLRQQLPEILAKRIDILSPRMIRAIKDLGGGGVVVG